MAAESNNGVVKVSALLEALQKKAAEDNKGRFEERVYAEKLMKKLPPIRVVGDEWFAYHAGAWRPVTREEFQPIAMAMCPKQYQKARNAQNLLDHVETVRQVKRSEMAGFHKFLIEVDGSQSILINAANGVVKITSGGEITLQKHSEEHGFTAAAAGRYDETAQCHLFLKTIEEALPEGEDRDLLRVFAGNILWPSSQFETALISFGKEGASKSTIAEAIRHALVDLDEDGDLVTSLSMTQLCDSRSYSLPKLRLAALNLGTEVDTVDLDESTNFKQAVSGEKIEARQIYGKPMAMRPTVKLWFLANTLPRFKNGTGAELRRLRFLQFDVVPEKKDTTLKERLQAERDGIFMWMLRGLLALQATGEIPHGGEKSRALVEKFAISNDPVGYFIKQECVLEPGARTQKKDLADRFKAFIDDRGLPETHADWFFRRIYERYPLQPVRFKDYIGDIVHGVVGLKLKGKPEPEPYIE